MVTSIGSTRTCGQGYVPGVKRFSVRGVSEVYPSTFHACNRNLEIGKMEHDGSHRCGCGLMFSDDEIKPFWEETQK